MKKLKALILTGKMLKHKVAGKVGIKQSIGKYW